MTDPLHAKVPGKGNNIGHFFMAIDPGLFRDPEDFRADVSTFIDALRSTKAVEGGEGVLVAGDPERAKLAKLMAAGIEVPKGLKAELRSIADNAGAPWLLK
jgi:LDH2 family malate/lactate/ureidoglycolate dehydrogenase